MASYPKVSIKRKASFLENQPYSGGGMSFDDLKQDAGARHPTAKTHTYPGGKVATSSKFSGSRIALRDKDTGKRVPDVTRRRRSKNG